LLLRHRRTGTLLAWWQVLAKILAEAQMTYRGKVKNGVVVFDNGIALEDGTEVRIEPIEITPRSSPNKPNQLFEAAKRAKSTGVTDLARNHDHYLYGHHKVGE
jgi:hypothetical protein